MIRKAFEAALALLLSAPVALAGAAESDYPTTARVDYVIGCMAANGQSREAMSRCACSVDTLASVLPYDRYVAAETILSMRQGVGQGASIFRNVPMYEDVIADLRRAQAEAEVRCFK
ncbi:hypothetical protein ACI7BZ_04935 [Xanthobacter sp. AM11]|uniref:hypothetical protein n=1 Tax=Xanthobacter sp. AM11 TaxID=3380643 RepID=UPI0039BFB2C4